MPSPIAHAAMGYLIYRSTRSRLPEEASRYVGPLPQLLIATVVFSVVPDLDSVVGLLAGDLGRFHNNLMNSFASGLSLALGVATAVWLRHRSGFRRWFIIALVSYQSHVLMDFLTVGRGVMLAWPLSPDRFESPAKLFYGLHWSDGLSSPRHLVTLATELGFIGVVATLARYVAHRRSAALRPRPCRRGRPRPPSRRSRCG